MSLIFRWTFNYWIFTSGWDKIIWNIRLIRGLISTMGISFRKIWNIISICSSLEVIWWAIINIIICFIIINGIITLIWFNWNRAGCISFCSSVNSLWGWSLRRNIACCISIWICITVSSLRGWSCRRNIAGCICICIFCSYYGWRLPKRKTYLWWIQRR